MAFQLSPGVRVVEKDFTSIVPSVSTSAGAFAGVFQWGPVLDPVTVPSENVLVQRFGLPNDDTAQSFFTAANFLSYSNNLLVVRLDTTDQRNAVVTESSGVTGVTIGNAGSNYTNATVSFSAPNISGGVNATGTVSLSGGSVSSIVVSQGGSGYSNATVTISAPDLQSGTQATATATIVGNAITAITINTPGSGYVTPPTVTITGNGTGATAFATVSGSTVTGVVITNPGTGYTSAPIVTITGDGSGAAATASINVGGVKVNNSSDYLTFFGNGQGVYGQFAAKFPGSLGNSLKVEVCDAIGFNTWAYKDLFDSAPSTSSYVDSLGGSDDEVHVVVLDKDGKWTGSADSVLEKFSYLSKSNGAKKGDGSNNYYKDVLNGQSRYVWWMDHPTGTNWGSAGSVDFTEVGALSFSLSGGEDDFSATEGQKQAGFALFANDELYDISLIALGDASAATATYVINNIAEVRKDCVVFISPKDVNSGDIIIGTGSDAANKCVAFRNALPSTSYAVLDSGYKYQYDRYNDKYRFVPLNGDIAGLCARTDYTDDPWFSPGGLNRGQIKNVTKLAFNPGKTERDTLYKVGVNPVVSFPGQGTVLFGDKTLLAKPSAFDRINVRRLFIVLEKAIATAAKFQLFEINDDFTRAQFRSLVEPFLRDVQGRRGITDFRVKCDSTNNTGEIVDRNEFVADIFIKPARSINFITLNFVAARTSANFTEIGA